MNSSLLDSATVFQTPMGTNLYYAHKRFSNVAIEFPMTEKRGKELSAQGLKR
jgi:hypothetical protein